MPSPDAIRDDNFFVTVNPLTTTDKVQVVPNGETWAVSFFQGSAAYNESTTAKLVWDYQGAGEEVVASTHGDTQFSQLHRTVVGDGVKKLAIVLDNQTQALQALGGRYTATKVS